ncbi:MAG TPA: DUF2380 domain-containing protein [Steroidobacteraceae bacterium]|nr:DUF2380 domain-containing protein [Steroidobacteraceae bacterium]
MQKMNITALVCSVLSAASSGLAGVALSSQTAEITAPAPAVLCEEAAVNPISGYAECVRPAGAPVGAPPPRPPVVKLAIFDFELDDVSPAASLLGQTISNETMMEKVSNEARRMLEKSGRFILVDVSEIDAEPIKRKSLRNCQGCEAALASQVGAEQALLGVVRRVTQTDYYVLVQISDARTGKVLNQQEANFAGGPDGWASGVRMLLKHQVLVTDQP